MMNKPREIVEAIRDLLRQNNEHIYDEYIDEALEGSEESFWSFLESNELWGGAGSIADQGCFENQESRKELFGLLVDLAKHQQEAGRVNVRTESWASTFNQLLEQGII